MGKCYLLVMSTRMDDKVGIRIYNNSQQAEDVREMGLNLSDDGKVQVIRRKRVGGQTSMRKKWFKIMDRFDLPLGSNDWILNSIRNKVKSWRARVKKDYYDPFLSFRDQINSKPKQVRLGD
ncbi:hypothetical protein Tco_0255510 [Tanacetum coccineum]